MKTLKMIYHDMIKEDMQAQPGGAFGDYPADDGNPAQGGEQPGYGGGPEDDARMPTGMYATNTVTGKKKKFTQRKMLTDFLAKNKEWKKGNLKK